MEWLYIGLFWLTLKACIFILDVREEMRKRKWHEKKSS